MKKKGLHIKAGGLLYPIEEKFNSQKCYSNNWLGNFDTKFIIDGIDLSKIEDLMVNDIVESEKAFIERLRELMN